MEAIPQIVALVHSNDQYVQRAGTYALFKLSVQGGISSISVIRCRPAECFSSWISDANCGGYSTDHCPCTERSLFFYLCRWTVRTLQTMWDSHNCLLRSLWHPFQAEFQSVFEEAIPQIVTFLPYNPKTVANVLSNLAEQRKIPVHHFPDVTNFILQHNFTASLEWLFQLFFPISAITIIMFALRLHVLYPS